MPASGNNLSFQCDWRFGFNLHARSKASVGYLLFFSGCGGMNLTKDIEVWNPIDSQGKGALSGPTVTCIGLIDAFSFDGGNEDPIRISAYVSKGIAADIRSKLATPLTNTKLKVSWQIVDFDDDKKVWYETALVRDNAKVDANIDTSGGELQMFIATDATRIDESLDLKVYKFEFQVVPASKKVALLEFATGPSQKLVKKWGEG